MSPTLRKHHDDELGPKREDLSATRRISLNIGENKENLWALVATVFFKYGISPIMVLLFAYWLQQKDAQLLAQYQREFDQTERVTLVMANNNKLMENNNRALDNLTTELRQKR